MPLFLQDDQVARIVVLHRWVDRAFGMQGNGHGLRISSSGDRSGSVRRGRGRWCGSDEWRCCVVDIDDATLEGIVSPPLSKTMSQDSMKCPDSQ